jgi:acylphosphatase
MTWLRGRSGQSGPQEPPEGTVRMTAFVHGYVQGVGFRWFTRSRAMELGLVGSATNLADGRVEVVVEGQRQACDDLLAWLRGGHTPGSVDQVVEHFAAARGTFKRFDVG